jgi:hypothetical protein
VRRGKRVYVDCAPFLFPFPSCMYRDSDWFLTPRPLITWLLSVSVDSGSSDSPKTTTYGDELTESFALGGNGAALRARRLEFVEGRLRASGGGCGAHSGTGKEEGGREEEGS